MKTSFIGNRTVALLAFAAVGFSVQAGAADGFLNVAKHEEVAAAAAADAKEQLERGIRAYDRGDYGEAFRLFRNVAVLGEAEAHYRLGLMYAEGLGTRKSLNLAAYWLRMAARQNYPGAAKALSTLKPDEVSS